MPAPTSLAVSVPSKEYSRYERGRDTLVATVTAVGGAPYVGEQIRVDMVKARNSRDAVVASAILVVDDVDPQVKEVSFHLPDIIDQDLISLIRFGKYFVRATALGNANIVAESSEFYLRIMTVEKFKQDYLFGLRMMSTELKMVKFQPTQITGVEIIEVSRNHAPGFGTLTHDYVAGPPEQHFLQWKGGPPVEITGPGTYLLRAGSSISGVGATCAGGAGAPLGDYIVVRVTSVEALPDYDVSEDLLIEPKKIDDETIATYLEQAVAWVENDLLHVFLEPTNVVTERDATAYQFAIISQSSQPIYKDSDYDFLTPPLTYFAPKKGTWVSLNTPFLSILRVDSLYGALGNTRVIDIDLAWIQFYQLGGMIQLVPYNSTVAFTYMGLIWNSTLNNLAELPSFWRYNMIVGLRDCPADIRELIAKKAAIDALTVLGMAQFPGLGSVSLGRDGVSQSVSYANQKYGNFSGPIQAYTDWLERELPRYLARYRGSQCIVV